MNKDSEVQAALLIMEIAKRHQYNVGNTDSVTGLAIQVLRQDEKARAALQTITEIRSKLLRARPATIFVDNRRITLGNGILNYDGCVLDFHLHDDTIIAAVLLRDLLYTLMTQTGIYFFRYKARARGACH